MERAFGEFVRRFQLPDNTDPEKIQAKVENGARQTPSCAPQIPLLLNKNLIPAVPEPDARPAEHAVASSGIVCGLHAPYHLVQLQHAQQQGVQMKSPRKQVSVTCIAGKQAWLNTDMCACGFPAGVLKVIVPKAEEHGPAVSQIKVE